MRTVGIIAEYNPFHTGHAYQIQKAKELARADYAVVVMSPDYVQRGEPAVFEKQARTRMALEGGADLVIELPVCYAAGSARYFAEGAVALLDALQVIDALCFGAETPDKAAFIDTAQILLNEPEDYRRALKENLRQGQTFPQARAEALHTFGASSDLLSSPNNLLGVEYCRVLLNLRSEITPLPIERIGSDYSSSSLTGGFCSATALRRSVLNGTAAKAAQTYVPAACRECFLQECGTVVTADDFLPVLMQKLLCRESFDDILDLSGELSDRIKNLRFSCVGKSFDEITALLKTRQVTDTRIRRVLLHLILGIRTEEVEAFRASGTVFYAKVSGFRASAAPLLHEIKKKSAVPLITKASDAENLFDPRKPAQKMWTQDLSAAHLYRSIRCSKYHLPFRSEYALSPVILNN